ncbi:2-acetamido-2-deoxy-D-galactose-binding seed lectin 2-like [Bidens hawaiensis]|uniref:2-acetamido-2-deoxy-D-galactose-binding seed lectin 2-like n=1 Tax=Bidens hawaiensis TaxID=980011 RepID=UPI004049A56D
MVILTYFLLLLLLLFLILHTASITFNFTQIGPQNLNIDIVTKGDSYITSDGIHLTAEDRSVFKDNVYTVGRATYVNTLHLWDKNSGELASFDTIFDFVVAPITNLSDGLTFFLAEDNSVRTGGAGLGLPVDKQTNSMTSPFVAVEFDTYWDGSLDPPSVEGTHVGIDINNLSSVTYQYWSGNVCQAHIKYDSVSKNFSVSVIDSGDGKVELHYIIDLKKVLPEWIIFGFTASTGPDSYFEKNIVRSWVFNSSDLGRNSTIQNSSNEKSGAG